MNPKPDGTDLSVDPVRVAGRRPILSAVLVGAVLISFVGLAIAKPWAPGRDAGTGGASPGPDTAAAATPTDAPTGSRSQRVEPTPLSFVPRTAELLASAVGRDEWGIRAIVVPAVTQRFDVNGPILVERWLPIAVDRGAAWNLANDGAAENAGDTVIAIGATTPAATMPTALSFWRLDGTSVPYEIAPIPVERSERGPQLWLPDPANSTSIGTWPGGTYRIDVAVGEQVLHLVMIVRG